MRELCRPKLTHCLALLLLLSPPLLFAQGTAFTYQARLSENGIPATGFYDLRFVIFDAAAGGNAVSGAITNTSAPVTNGVFAAVTLDFGHGVFTGPARWLEIGVRTNGGGAFTTLAPRQPITPAPYALLAHDVIGPNIARLNVPNTAQQATAVPVVTSGFITSANITSGGSGYVAAPTVIVSDTTGSGAVITATVSNGAVVRLTVQDAGSGYSQSTTLTIGSPPSNAYQIFSSTNFFNGVNFLTNPNNTISGNGAALTSLNAAQLSSGTVSDARLSANVALLNSPQTFTGSKMFSGPVTLSNPLNQFTGNGSGLTALSAPSLIGTISDARLSANVTLLGSSIESGEINAGSFNTTFWRAGGNAGTTAGTHFLGTVDNQPLEFRASSNRVMRFESRTNMFTNPLVGPITNVGVNVLGGSPLNVISNGVVGATIAGGGRLSLRVAGTFLFPNLVSDDYGTIGGGDNNVAGDQDNVPSDAAYATVGGGLGNIAAVSESTIGGGQGNVIVSNSTWATIGGGKDNLISQGPSAVIGGGSGNSITNSDHAVIAGGSGNTVVGFGAAIGGGSGNRILGGASSAVIPGGSQNTVSGDNSFAAGFRAKALHHGTFVWADSTNADFASTTNNQFLIRASRGVGINTTNPAAALHVAGNILATGTITPNSDRNAKTGIVPLDPKTILERLAKLPLHQWRFKAEPEHVKHAGPMAQDFYAAFGLGARETAIATVDADGVALAAIQGLMHKLEIQRSELEQNKKEMEELRQNLAELRELMKRQSDTTSASKRKMFRALP